MKTNNIGRAIATIAVMLGGIGIAYFTEGSFIASVCVIILMFFVWNNA